MGARTEEQARPCHCPAGHPWAGLRPLWASLLEALQGPPRLSWEQTLFGLEGAPPPGEGGSTIPACALPLPQSKAGHGLWGPPCGPKRAWAQVTGLSGLPDAAGSQQGGSSPRRRLTAVLPQPSVPAHPHQKGQLPGHTAAPKLAVSSALLPPTGPHCQLQIPRQAQGAAVGSGRLLPRARWGLTHR